jgi:hypothetical protein
MVIWVFILKKALFFQTKTRLKEGDARWRREVALQKRGQSFFY